MSIKTLEGRFNANKEKTISLLKEKGSFIEHCQENGFIYTISGNLYDKNHRFTLALKNGKISLLGMQAI